MAISSRSDAEQATGGRHEWDENKRRINLDKHLIDFQDILPLFEGVFYTEPSHRGEELRDKSIGEIQGIVIVVIHTERQGCRRIISARKACQNERDTYRKYCAQISRG